MLIGPLGINLKMELDLNILIKKIYIYIFESVVCKMNAILFRPE